MSLATLTLQNIRARPVMLKLKRPVVARIATLTDWPLILIDLYTEEGVIAAAIAAAAGIPISTHLYPEVAAHVMRVSETAHWLEWQDWANPILQQPYEVKDGELLIPDEPGVGLEWDEKAVVAHLADNF